MPSVTDYDLIVVDEAHRGYILDREMSETEMLYRNQDDYISKYRTVIEYFDAVKIALTATPALHTTEIFGKPVFNYSYREAVIDGYLVDMMRLIISALNCVLRVSTIRKAISLLFMTRLLAKFSTAPSWKMT